jgi:hypothetical protein
MFQSPVKRLRRLVTLAEDLLGDPPEPETPHPHRRPLRLERQRRLGSVPARPAHCLSPVRPSFDQGRRQQPVR